MSRRRRLLDARVEADAGARLVRLGRGRGWRCGQLPQFVEHDGKGAVMLVHFAGQFLDPPRQFRVRFQNMAELNKRFDNTQYLNSFRIML